ncbi:MAG TPA: type I DNA topoisomerase [Sedimentisphaerales bacterium]|jgi:DNA topoisomerase-1|nr:type I DNA topoisomerase [Sedimentisphaerales bacterium]HNU31195.1 type I DNA topoisomerase [Sedimentisphaerales bacterium]
MAKSNSHKSLVIVESPAKAKTINRYLGPDYEVHASMGHVRDLPSKGLNVDIENNFEPTYDIMPGKRRVVTQLKAAAKKCDKLYLATDLDREGEAIAWHLAQVLGVPEDRTYRVIFNAITKTAIKEAFADPGRIDTDKVMAQQARRVLDRIVGYEISPLLWKKVTRGLSAGRVQSVAVKIIVEREKEIRAFKPEEYWLIPAVFTTDLNANYHQQWIDFITPKTPDGKPPTIEQQSDWLAQRNAFKAELSRIGDQRFSAANEQDAQKVFRELQNAQFKIAEIETKESASKASPPFITSTLQQAAANRLGFTAKRTMAVAQQLYEGIDLGSMGSLGLITYMRTDSTHLSGEALGEVRNYIQSHFGPTYLPEKPNFYADKKSAQQAHEAIRPTDVDLTPQEIREHLNEEQFKLYDLIWRRFVACQMEPARWNVTTLNITAPTSVGTALYKAAGRSLVFDGYSRVWQTGSTEQQLPATQVGQSLATVDIEAEQHFTKPPARYTEASLVKALEKEGIGRPSTYAPIISTIQDRGYVEQKDRKFFATDLGEVVTAKLDEFFPRIMDIAFTRQMEEQLDRIEEQHLDWVRVLQEFYGPFKANLATATAEMKHAKAEATPSEYNCPDCGRQLMYKFGKNGKFLSCSGYPECKFACPCDKEGKMMKDEVSEHKCPNCGKPMIRKNGRFGAFLGCSDYPTCKTTLRLDKEGNPLPPKPPAESTGIKCHKCRTGELVIRKSKRGPFLGCNKFPRCRTIVSAKGIDRLKELQAAGEWPPKDPQRTQEILNEIKGEKAVAAKK